MNICGVLVHAHPQKIDAVAAALTEIPGLEIHARGDGGRLVVTLEDTERGLALHGVENIHRTPGVVAASLVYHQFEPELAQDAPVAEI
jgi:nitrate reductase NapD